MSRRPGMVLFAAVVSVARLYSVEEPVLKKAMLVVLMAVALTSCGSAAGQENAPREGDAGEETASLEATSLEGLTVEETTEAMSSSPEEPDVEPTQSTTTSPAVGGRGMVSSASPYATRAGLGILDEGGNAFDAAVAVAATLGVAEPMMSGLGGYGAIVVYDAEEGETKFLETGSRTPASLDPEAFRSTAPNFVDNRCGPKAVATPGNLNAWERLSEDHGDLEWGRLFEPAIEAAEDGVVIDGITAGWIGAAWPAFPENARTIYGTDAGAPLGAGETLVQEDLGRSMRLISEEGVSAMYNGALGESIASGVQEGGGYLTTDDLNDNAATWRETVSLDHRGYEVVMATPPATSWNSLLRLGVMGQFDFEPSDHNTVNYLHTFAEANKQAGQAARGYAADPEVQETPLDYLLSNEFLTQTAAGINPSQAAPNSSSSPFGTPTRCTPQSYTAIGATTSTPEARSHTTHFVVADDEGNVVSATQTLGNIFGSKVMPEGTGIWLNDAIAWLRFEPPGNVFDVFPGRQSLYALCPTIVTQDGRPVIALGTPGGRTIPQTTPQMLMNHIDFGMDIQQAVAAPRVSSSQNALVAETGIPSPVRDGLSALGHSVEVDERGLGNAHALTIEYGSNGEPSQFTGGADPRGVGVAVGR